MSTYDLRTCSYDEFLDFVFEHPVSIHRWYDNSDLKVVYDANRNRELLIELFTNSKPLYERYTREQLEQGFWALLGGCAGESIEDIMFDQSVPFEKRAEFIRAMFFLYEGLFSIHALQSACNMWWDCISGDYAVHNRSQKSSEDDRKIQDVMFETLTKILYLESEECQGGALHGLGHLRHPNTEKVIRDWIATQPYLPEYDLEYAEACITGDIL